MSAITSVVPREPSIESIPLRRVRYELEPRPAVLGGGWRLHLIAAHPETGEDIEAGSGVFPDVLEPICNDEDPQAAAIAAGDLWLDSGEWE